MELARTDDVDKLKTKFTELGQTIVETSQRNIEMMDSSLGTLNDRLISLQMMVTGDEFSSVTTGLGALGTDVTAVSDFLQAKFDESSASFRDINDMNKGLYDSLKKMVDEQKLSGAGSGQTPVPLRADPAVDKDKEKKKPSLIGREMRSLSGRVNTLLGKLKLPKPGTMIAGGLMWMAYGFQEKDRMKQELGEVKNFMVYSFDAGIKGIVDKTARSVAGLQEHLQKFYGIARQEVQGVYKTFVDAGVGLQGVMSQIDSSLGLVGKNVGTFTLGLDKLFELSGGSTAKQTVNLMQDYGMSVKQAAESMANLYLNQQSMSTGSVKFAGDVIAAADSVKDMGLSFTGVLDVATAVQERFTNIGLPKQFAQSFSARGVQEMNRGISSLSLQWKRIIGERLGKGEGLEAVNWVEDSFARISRGDEAASGDYLSISKEMYKIAMEATDGDESRAKFMLSRDMGAGVAGAQVIMEIGKMSAEGDEIGAAKAAKRGMKALKDSLKTEKEKMSDLQKGLNKWMKGVSEVGMGLLAIVGDTMATLVAYFRVLPAMFMNFFDGRDDKNAQLMMKVMSFTGGMSGHAQMIRGGLSKMSSGGKELFGTVFESSMDALESAYDIDPYAGVDGKERQPIIEGADNYGKAQMPMVQRIVVPVTPGGSAMVGLMPEMDKMMKQASQKQGFMWAGGGIKLVTKGVSERGDIELEIQGNCPRCGLGFGTVEEGLDAFSSMGLEGEGVYTGEDVEALARMLEKEAGGYRKSRAEEVLSIAHTALNRVKPGGVKPGELYKKITGGHGWGKQGGKRQYASGTSPRKATVDFARKILRGGPGMGDPTGGATHFFHASPGSQFGKKHKMGAGPEPPFMRKGRAGYTRVIPTGKGQEAAFFGKMGAKDTDEGKRGKAFLQSRGRKGSIPSRRSLRPQIEMASPVSIMDPDYKG